MKGKKLAAICVAVLFLLAVSIELQPVTQCYSSVFSTSEGTEIELHILMNTLLSVNVDEIVNETISDHQRINGVRENTVYKLYLYRTGFLYRKNWVYDTIICDENGI